MNYSNIVKTSETCLLFFNKLYEIQIADQAGLFTMPSPIEI